MNDKIGEIHENATPLSAIVSTSGSDSKPAFKDTRSLFLGPVTTVTTKNIVNDMEEINDRTHINSDINTFIGAHRKSGGDGDKSDDGLQDDHEIHLDDVLDAEYEGHLDQEAKNPLDRDRKATARAIDYRSRTVICNILDGNGKIVLCNGVPVEVARNFSAHNLDANLAKESLAFVRLWDP